MWVLHSWCTDILLLSVISCTVHQWLLLDASGGWRSMTGLHFRPQDNLLPFIDDPATRARTIVLRYVADTLLLAMYLTLPPVQPRPVCPTARLALELELRLRTHGHSTRTIVAGNSVRTHPDHTITHPNQ